MSFSEESTINIVINHLKINNGDTIKLNIDKFIACKGEILQISDINLIATNKNSFIKTDIIMKTKALAVLFFYFFVFLVMCRHLL